MDFIKMEPEVDPLAFVTSCNTYIEEKKPLLEKMNLLDLHVTEIKTESLDQSYNNTSEIGYGETSVPTNFSTEKCDSVEWSCDVDTVKEELKLEVTAEQDEVLTEGIGVLHGDTVSSEFSSVCLEEHISVEQSSDIALSSHIPACKTPAEEISFAKANFHEHTAQQAFKCRVCGKCFSESADLEEHARLHTRKSSVKCEVCGKCFTQATSLHRHAGLHTGERPFKCDVCGKSFSQAWNLKMHSRVHTGERAFECHVCGKCFLQPGNLTTHARIHTGERPFVCNVCGKAFALSGGLKKHSRLHTGERPFKCDVCGKSFSDSGTLRDHARVHTGEKPFKCDICGNCYSHRRSIKYHKCLPQ
ncbi:zinc finger protein 664-like [Periplaneta americana]|uniref:zinc finger protein 664-like n=1 Tax=Periplaneta americana TaxID=6978 RepID=UPI0037E7E9C0